MRHLIFGLLSICILSCNNTEKETEEIKNLRLAADSLKQELSKKNINYDSNEFIDRVLDLYDYLIAETPGNSKEENYKFYIADKLEGDGNGYRLQSYLMRISMPIYEELQDSKYVLGMDPIDDIEFKDDKDSHNYDFAQYYFAKPSSNSDVIANLYKLKIKTMQYIIDHYEHKH